MNYNNLFERIFKFSIRLIILALILAPMTTGCSSKRMLKTASEFRVARTVLTRDYEKYGGLESFSRPAKKFSTNDSKITSLVKLSNISGEHNIQWKWYNPKGKLYTATEPYSVSPSKGKFIRDSIVCHHISMKGDPAQYLTGDWTVDVFLDGVKTKSSSFKVQPFYGKKVIVEDNLTTVVADASINIKNCIPKTKIKNPDAVAVVIGNRKYKSKDVPMVEYAVRDAEAIRKFLINTLGFRKQNIIFKENATTSDFNDIFGNRSDYRGDLFNYVKEGRSDVFIYYSGHGAPDIRSKQGYFVPVNCKPTKISMNGYPLEQFYNNISKINAKSMTVVVDACFSGGTASGKTLIQGASPIGIKIMNPVLLKDNVVCLSSSAGNQFSSWHKESKQGLFTYFFLKAVSGEADKNRDKKITYNEIYNYITDKHDGVPYYARRYYDRDQNPVMFGRNLTIPLVYLGSLR